MTETTHPSALAWGKAVAEQLLPWAQTGGDVVSRDYCRRIGFEPTARQLRALAIAYWIHRLAYQLGHYADRGSRWIEANVGVVLTQLLA